MKWTNHSKLEVYGIRLEGWPSSVPMQNPSSLSVAQNLEVLDALRSGKMRFISIRPKLSSTGEGLVDQKDRPVEGREQELQRVPMTTGLDSEIAEPNTEPHDKEDDGIFDDAVDFDWGREDVVGSMGTALYDEVAYQTAQTEYEFGTEDLFLQSIEPASAPNRSRPPRDIIREGTEYYRGEKRRRDEGDDEKDDMG